MAGLIGSLSDSQLVARFQRRCGLFPQGEDDQAQKARAVGNGSRPLPPRDVRNGQRPSVSLPADCATCNSSPADGWKDCSQDYVVKNYFYYYLFRVSAAMGQEIFYITFLPFTYWIINPYVSRRLIIMWPVVMYIGQVMKDLLKWPRPLSPPVVKLEKKTNAEYGMPSTHAMAATAISFTFVAVTANRYKYPLELGLSGAFLFSALVCLSRIYTGMHTVLVLDYIIPASNRNCSSISLESTRLGKDVIVGSLISLFLTAVACPTWDFVDRLMLTSPLCPAFCITVPLFLCYNYPKLVYYSPTRADTTTILGAAAGTIIGFWVNNRYVSNASSEDVTYSVSSNISEIILLALAKFLVGIGVLMVTRQIAKTITCKSLCSWHKVSSSDVVAMQQIKIEVPYKFITYSSIGLSATVFVPLLYTFLGLN